MHAASPFGSGREEVREEGECAGGGSEGASERTHAIWPRVVDPLACRLVVREEIREMEISHLSLERE